MTNQTDQSERWVVVTGASSGIGRCVALGLQQQGYRVLASARRREDLHQLAAAGLVPIALRLEDSASVNAAIAIILETCHGDLYGLVNNAAYGQPGAVEDLSRSALEQQFAVNLFGTHQLTQGLLPALHQKQGGRLISISSVLGLVAFPWQGAYNASKFALEGLTDTLRLELRGSNVQVSLIEPGPIRSAFRRRALSAFDEQIGAGASRHRHHYERVCAYYAATDHPTPFTAGPEAVLKRVLHALSAERAQPRYAVTLPTYVLGFCRRVLPTRWLDALLHRLGAMR
ncbi:MAG: SDR family NAD(P)-dependent oxidoreductase [Desulfuromonadaceae bacterium]|nr:SDR family NAD(P)-dependent oxidoreductase [Desulfuromonadaceae bacterium]